MSLKTAKKPKKRKQEKIIRYREIDAYGIEPRGRGKITLERCSFEDFSKDWLGKW